jgi:hypothetical protein
MQGFIISLAVGAVFAMGAVALVLAVYLGTRRLLSTGNESDRTLDVASSVAFRIAALYGLILALVYAQELEDYKGIRTNLAEESVAAADVYNDIARYGGPTAGDIQANIARDLDAVVNQEWEMLGRRAGLAPEAWQSWNEVYLALLDLQPENDRQRYLANRMRDRVTDIARYRQIRESNAVGSFSGLFWGPALFGLVLLTMPFYVFAPTRNNLVLISVFGLYSGVILFFIYMFANPFEQPGKLQPIPFIHLLNGEIGKSLPPTHGKGA